MPRRTAWGPPASPTAMCGAIAVAPESSTKTFGPKAGVDAAAPFGLPRTHEARAAKASTAVTKRAHARHGAAWLEPTTLPRLRTAGPLLTYIGGSLRRAGGLSLQPHQGPP